MKYKVGILICCSLLWCTVAFAHVMTQDNVFEDLAYSQVPEDVLLANALGIVSYEDDKYVYRPQDTLTMKELAAWTASYHKLHGENTDALANAALQEGLVASLTGNATYEAVNIAFFHGKLTVEDPQATMTRDEFAEFIVEQATVDLGGHTLYDMSQFTAGPTGIIEAVKAVDKQMPDGKTKKVYELTIDGKAYELALHPRVFAKTVDPLVWEGMTVVTSWFGPNVATDQAGMHQHGEHSHGEHSHAETESVTLNTDVAQVALQYMELQTTEKTLPSEEHTANHEVEASETPAHEDEPQQDKTTNVWWIVGVGILLLAVILYYMRSKKNK